MLTIDELLRMMEDQAARADFDAAVRANDILGADGNDAQKYMLRVALNQWYHRGAIDATTRSYPKRLRA